MSSTSANTLGGAAAATKYAAVWGGAAVMSEGTAALLKGVSLLVAAAGIAVIGFHYGKRPTDYEPISV